MARTVRKNRRGGERKTSRQTHRKHQRGGFSFKSLGAPWRGLKRSLRKRKQDEKYNDSDKKKMNEKQEIIVEEETIQFQNEESDSDESVEDIEEI